MSRHYNQDYFKVSGSPVDDRDRALKSKSRLSHQRATLRDERSPAPRRRPTAGAGGRPAAKPHAPRSPPAAHIRAVPSPEGDLQRRASERAAETRRPPVVLKAVTTPRPVRGKKRRSTVKRHETEVIEELRAHPEVSPQSAGYAVRHGEISASVIGIREKRPSRMPHEPPPSAMPDALPPTGVIDFVRRVFLESRSLLLRQTAEAIHRLAELVLPPMTEHRGIPESRAKP